MATHSPNEPSTVLTKPSRTQELLEESRVLRTKMVRVRFLARQAVEKSRTERLQREQTRTM